MYNVCNQQHVTLPSIRREKESDMAANARAQFNGRYVHYIRSAVEAGRPLTEVVLADATIAAAVHTGMALKPETISAINEAYFDYAATGRGIRGSSSHWDESSKAAAKQADAWHNLFVAALRLSPC